MNSWIYSTILTLAATIATANLSTVAVAQTVNYDRSAPRIVSTDVDRSNSAHEITLYTGARPLSYLRITPPNDVQIGEDVQVMTESGREIEAFVFKSFSDNNQAILAFAQPVPARTTLEIVMDDVSPVVPGAGAFFNYELAGKHLGLKRLIPYGIARFQVNNPR